MTDLANKLNIIIGDEPQNGIVFAWRTLTKTHKCSIDIIEEALNDAGYSTDGIDYTTDDLITLCHIVDDHGSLLQTDEVLEKTIWFD